MLPHCYEVLKDEEKWKNCVHPGDMGGRMASGVSHMPSHDAFGDSANTVRVSNDDEAPQNGEEEEKSSSEE